MLATWVAALSAGTANASRDREAMAGLRNCAAAKCRLCLEQHRAMPDRCADQPALNANAPLIDPGDNVAVALAEIAAGSAVIVSSVASLEAGARKSVGEG